MGTWEEKAIPNNKQKAKRPQKKVLNPSYTCIKANKKHSLFDFLNLFFRFSFFSFSFLFAAVIDLPLGLLPVRKILRKHL